LIPFIYREKLSFAPFHTLNEFAAPVSNGSGWAFVKGTVPYTQTHTHAHTRTFICICVCIYTYTYGCF